MNQAIDRCKVNLKKLFVSYHLDCKKKVTQAAGKTLFFTLFKLNITFYSKCYSHHNCRVNHNWNNMQLYSSAKPLHKVPIFVLWFANFCFLPFLRRTSVHKWKKNGLCYVHKWIGKKEMLAKTSKCLCQNLFIYIHIHIALMSPLRMKRICYCPELVC